MPILVAKDAVEVSGVFPTTEAVLAWQCYALLPTYAAILVRLLIVNDGFPSFMHRGYWA